MPQNDRARRVAIIVVAVVAGVVAFVLLTAIFDTQR